MDRGAWWATVHEAAKSQTRLSDLACMREDRRPVVDSWPVYCRWSVSKQV